MDRDILSPESVGREKLGAGVPGASSLLSEGFWPKISVAIDMSTTAPFAIFIYSSPVRRKYIPTSLL
jgi:hypothetical protein